MLVCFISCLYAVDILFSRIWLVGTMPFAFIHSKAHRRAKIISPSVFFHGINPGVVAINFIPDHLVPVSPARPVREIPRLVYVHGPLGFIQMDEDIVFFLCRG